MAFLEAMAMGKCIVAHNDATMNEYIKDGVNGILFDADRPIAITESQVLSVRSNIHATKEQFYGVWLEDMKKISNFIFIQKPCAPFLLNRLKILLSYPIFLIEGVCYYLKNKFRSK
jgi:glycosyltransferase involved in cell wall biosynthesis